jgi:hypothetical protein
MRSRSGGRVVPGEAPRPFVREQHIRVADGRAPSGNNPIHFSESPLRLRATETDEKLYVGLALGNVRAHRPRAGFHPAYKLADGMILKGTVFHLSGVS